LQVELTNLSADVDLYVRKDSSPTLTSYDCRPYNGGTSSETCTLSNSGSATWYISVQGYEAGSFNLKATLSGGSTVFPADPLTSGQAVSSSVGLDGWKNYKITSASSDTQLQVDLTNLSADVDLYVRKDSSPTLTSYDCRPYRGGTNSESCTLTNSDSATWYISVHGYQAGSFNLAATLSGSGSTVTELTSGQQVSDFAGYHLWKKYKITSSASDAELKVDMTNLSSDVDLYVQQGAEPSLTSYACRPYAGGTTSESCTLTNNGATEWYVSVYGYTAGNFDLKATLSGISSTVTELTSGQQVSDSAGYHAWKKYKITSSASDAELKVDMTNLSSDVDLYVQQGAEPSLTSYACRPYAGGTTSESCTLTNNGATEWYVSVYGYTAGNFDLKATLSEESGSGITELTSGQQVSDSAEYHNWVNYKITASSSDTQLQVDMTGLSADVDLYVKKGAMPTLSSYDCRPYSGGTNSESCTNTNSGSNVWYISVYGYQAGSFDLKAVLSGGSAGSFPNSALIDAFVSDNENECVDTDGAYGCQCVDLMHWYVAEVLGIPTSAQGGISGNAYSIYAGINQSVLLSSGSRTVRLEKIPNTPTGIPNKGDIIFWNTSLGANGHVAVFLNGDVNNFTSLDQNWFNANETVGSPAAQVNHNYTSVAGWLRPVLVSP
jgi:hypothetical protein